MRALRGAPREAFEHSPGFDDPVLGEKTSDDDEARENLVVGIISSFELPQCLPRRLLRSRWIPLFQSDLGKSRAAGRGFAPISELCPNAQRLLLFAARLRQIPANRGKLAHVKQHVGHVALVADVTKYR